MEGMADPPSISPSRLDLARRRRGLSKKQLAIAMGVERQSVTAYGSGAFNPRPTSLKKIARILKFPEPFFLGAEVEEPALEAATFSAITKMAARQRDKVSGCVAIALIMQEWIESRFTLPPLDLPDFGDELTPEEAAGAVRRDWKLGELPIKNMVHLLEARGVCFYSLPRDVAEVGSFSLWRQGRPLVLLDTRHSAEGTRFDVAHELGHLVLHRSNKIKRRSVEREADALASAFMMPAETLRSLGLPLASLDQLLRLGRIWRVPPAAVAGRLHRLGLLSDWQYRKLRITNSRRVTRTTEIESAPYETSQVLTRAFAVLRAEGDAEKIVADTFHVHPRDMNELVFGLALGNLDAPPRFDRVRRRVKPRLTVVA